MWLLCLVYGCVKLILVLILPSTFKIKRKIVQKKKDDSKGLVIWVYNTQFWPFTIFVFEYLLMRKFAFSFSWELLITLYWKWTGKNLNAWQKFLDFRAATGSLMSLYFWSQDPYNRYVLLLGSIQKFCLKIAKIENCQNWKLLGLKVVKV